MTTFEIHQLRKNGRFTNRAAIRLIDRLSPQGETYVDSVSMDRARRIVANEVASFTSCGLPVKVIHS